MKRSARVSRVPKVCPPVIQFGLLQTQTSVTKPAKIQKQRAISLCCQGRYQETVNGATLNFSGAFGVFVDLLL